MLLRLAQTLEQLDLALEHLLKGDPNNARFGLMLTDNALEISLHRLAQEHAHNLRPPAWMVDKPYKHTSSLTRALGQDFAAKTKFARAIGLLSFEEAESIVTSHAFRNETYHVGVQHEEVLPQIANFYFTIVCSVLSRYEPQTLGWSSGQIMPERAKKFFREDRFFPGSTAEWQRACNILNSGCAHTDADLINALFSHLAEVIDEEDRAIQFLAEESPKPTSRQQVTVDVQAWSITFSDEGRTFIQKNSESRGSVLGHVEWIAKNYPFKLRADPVPSWRRRASALRSEPNPHLALKKYRAFMDQTREFRGWLGDATAALDTEIGRQIDVMRGK